MLRAAHKRTLWRRAAGLRYWVLGVALAAGPYAGRGVWLPWMGGFLVRAEPPQAADVAVVLAGDGYGNRIMRAVELQRQGYVKQIIVDGPLDNYDFDEATMAIQFAMRRGAPGEIFIPLPMPVRSTVAEAQVVDPEMQRRGVRKVLIVTSNFHTRRAGAVFRRYGSPAIHYVVVAAPDHDFRPEDWWLTRDAQKVVFLEYVKLVSWWLGV
ncbi:MAG: YdcF family protein [Acidobacteria bacterium]|nr:YdcF family protein [Acidobacteriota bacterium]